MFCLYHKSEYPMSWCFLAISCKLLEIIPNLKNHYIWGRPNQQFGADYIGKMNLSQKCGDLR